MYEGFTGGRKYEGKDEGQIKGRREGERGKRKNAGLTTCALNKDPGRVAERQKENPTRGSSTDGHRQSDRAELFTRSGGGERERKKPHPREFYGRPPAVRSSRALHPLKGGEKEGEETPPDLPTGEGKKKPREKKPHLTSPQGRR